MESDERRCSAVVLGSRSTSNLLRVARRMASKFVNTNQTESLGRLEGILDALPV
ncbi:unnamed protein product [Amoebophrya sp. A120]|nr:unnamed protein product [Amoebophrya sp. A120]|eukprot:GSA120T00010147001.1